jgi:hypothetical protein
MTWSRIAYQLTEQLVPPLFSPPTRHLGRTSKTTPRSRVRYGLHLYGYGVFDDRDEEAGGCDFGEVRRGNSAIGFVLKVVWEVCGGNGI